jgi:hypothetical protein
MSGGQKAALQVQGDLVSDDGDKWIVDITRFIKANPQYKDNNLVQFVDGNFCLYTGRRDA